MAAAIGPSARKDRAHVSGPDDGRGVQSTGQRTQDVRDGPGLRRRVASSHAAGTHPAIAAESGTLRREARRARASRRRVCPFRLRDAIIRRHLARHRLKHI
eukprot:7882137-Pyramimonas_sp.AAC.1